MVRVLSPLRLCAGLLVLSTLACGFMEDVERHDAAAVRRLDSVLGTPLPTGAASAHTIETTGIDWLLNGEATVPRAVADPWFDALVLPCDQATVALTAGGPALFRMVGGAADWQAPADASWRGRQCENTGPSGPQYDVSITTDGDPAWIFVRALSM
jgi:hypothetical protein